uniref:CHHC U11-48K-type domain-containing protein n=1 Tax=Kalanchoe fedtschenkoi TaxID=63787 RepID=A0A7N1A9E1_KALFE
MNSHHHPPPPQFLYPPPTHFPIPPPNPNPYPNFKPSPQDLATTLSALTNLIQLTEQTLSSPPICDIARKFDNDADDGFAQCPFYPNHRMPACSLFAHYLNCPNSLDLNHLLSSLRYPRTLESSRSERLERRGGELEDELRFSVDGYGDFCVNFFYKDCPGVVGSVQERDGEKRVFTVPRVLYMECEDFLGGDEARESEKGVIKLLVCEFWLGRCEVESWSDYPGFCSLRVLKMISNVGAVEDVELKKWVIVNSPRYGVVIDKAMRDHIVLLLKLCLRPMAKEAYRLVKSQMGQKGSKETGESDYMNSSFDCKFMNKVLGWLVSQLIVLYGEGNGKYFGINMLKNCIMEAGQCSLLFPLEEKKRESRSSKEYPESSNNHDCETRDAPKNLASKRDAEPDVSRKVHDGILLSQVAAAVAALYERSVLERKIRGFRIPQPLPKHQIAAEHEYLTNKAREERQKRPNYRSIVEHDGLVWQHSHNQETNKTKTREELLAEERDYKRRRMSYRGKKMKRSTTQVMRHMIEDYMEEIKLAGGIGCHIKGSEEGQLIRHDAAHHEYADI